jgi:hypothetical protein
MVPAQGVYEDGKFGGMMIGRGNKIINETMIYFRYLLGYFERDMYLYVRHMSIIQTEI